MSKSLTLLALIAIFLLTLAPPVFGAARIFLDQIEGLYQGKAVVDRPVRFVFRAEYTPGDGNYIAGFSNGFKVWTVKDGAYTDNFTPVTFDTIPITPSWLTRFDLTVDTAMNGTDGLGVDTVGVFAVRLAGTGFDDGFNQIVWYVETTPTVAGDTLCLDSAVFNPPSGEWLWVDSYNMSLMPGWDGPHCLPVIPDPDQYVCGDVNGDGIYNLLDVTYTINYLYFGGPPPVCPFKK